MPSKSDESKSSDKKTKAVSDGVDTKAKPISGSTIPVVIQETSDGAARARARAVREGGGFSSSLASPVDSAVNDPRILDEDAQNIALAALFEEMTTEAEAEKTDREAEVASGEIEKDAEEEDEQKIICSGCYQTKDMIENHVIPTWNETLENFVTSFRCDGCWRPSLDDTRRRIEATNNPILVKMLVDFFGRHKIAQDDFRAATTTPERKTVALRLLNDIRTGRLVIPLGETIALTKEKMDEMRRVWKSANGEADDPLAEFLDDNAKEEAILAKRDAPAGPAKRQNPAAVPPPARRPGNNTQTILANITGANKKKPGGWFNA